MKKHPNQILYERIEKFSLDTLTYCKSLNLSYLFSAVIQQLVKSSVSVCSNYCEADNAESSKDFIHKIAVAKKEAREAEFQLKALSILVHESKIPEGLRLSQECKEIRLILNSIYYKVKYKNVAK